MASETSDLHRTVQNISDLDLNAPSRKAGTQREGPTNESRALVTDLVSPPPVTTYNESKREKTAEVGGAETDQIF